MHMEDGSVRHAVIRQQSFVTGRLEEIESCVYLTVVIIRAMAKMGDIWLEAAHGRMMLALAPSKELPAASLVGLVQGRLGQPMVLRTLALGQATCAE